MPISERKANMKKRVSFIALILSAVMLASTLAACDSSSSAVTDTEETSSVITSEKAETSSATEATNDTEATTETEAVQSEKETESNAPQDTESDTEPAETEEEYQLDTTPLALETTKDLYPDFKEYENKATENIAPPVYVPFDKRVEAEDYEEDLCTITWSNKVTGDEYSGGAFMRLLSSATEGWDHVYSVSYKVTVPAAGYYNVTALTSDIGQDYTSDYYVDINGTRQLNVNKTTAKQLEDINYSFDKGLFFVFELGNISLNEGENLITFVINNEDSKVGQNRLSFFFDYFTLSAVKPEAPDISSPASIALAVDVSKVEDGDVIAGSAAVNVFDQRFPLKLNFGYYFQEDGEITYTIKNYFGDTVYDGKLAGTQYDLVTVERTIKNHPTGYFTLTCGNQTFSYVVTPAYDTRTLESSPFAMDYASSYHNKDLTNCYNVTAAARLAGVTWVRERAGWDSYEKTAGNYTFSGTENRFKTITSTGMNLLVDLCPAPTWATKNEGYTGTSRVGGFRDNQLEFYNMCKAMAAYYDGVVDAWELWNESDHGFAVETAELFAAWYKAGALGVLEGDPDAIVTFGGYCQPNSNMDYVHLSMLNDLLKYSTVYNYHSHWSQASNYSFQTFIANMANTAHASAALYNRDYLRPVWVTEAGMRIDKMVYESYINQANYIITSTAQSLSIGTDMHYWFLLSPYMEAGGDFGSFSPSLEPYPTIAAEAIMTKVLGKAEYLGKPMGLPESAYGFTFYNGSRIVSVLWSTKAGDKYTIETNEPIIVTDMMGGETLMTPVDGKIQLRLSMNPIYVTYTNAPEYYEHDIADHEYETLTFTAGERVVLSPEFENYDINDASIKLNGHLVYDGLKINLRITNYNSFAVTGTVSGSLMGFEVVGGDKEITIEPCTEKFVTLTLKKTGSEPVNSYIIFSGIFNGEETSLASAHVHTEGALDKGKISLSAIAPGKYATKATLSALTATLEEADAPGTPLILVNDKVYENYTYENSTFTIDFSTLEAGKYTVIIAVETDGGDYIFKYMIFTYDGKKAYVENVGG